MKGKNRINDVTVRIHPKIREMAYGDLVEATSIRAAYIAMHLLDGEKSLGDLIAVFSESLNSVEQEFAGLGQLAEKGLVRFEKCPDRYKNTPCSDS